MVLAFHSIFCAYAFWLPNEDRGSGSDYVGSPDLLRFGPATKVQTRRSVAHHAYDRERKRDMQAALQHPPVRFDAEQIQIIARALLSTPYVFHALAVMTEHVHAVTASGTRNIRQAVGHMKAEATRALRAAGHFLDQPVWGDHGWNVFLDSEEDVQRACRYTEDNPPKERLPRQRWSGVVPYDPSCSRLAQARRERRG